MTDDERMERDLRAGIHSICSRFRSLGLNYAKTRDLTEGSGILGATSSGQAVHVVRIVDLGGQLGVKPKVRSAFFRSVTSDSGVRYEFLMAEDGVAPSVDSFRAAYSALTVEDALSFCCRNF
ncbi:MAG: hypothetical protein KDI13_07710 [Alphaproteobacteria bacterium]|nr:hypothetical protein [Alphaproteobacteria bacterium]